MTCAPDALPAARGRAGDAPSQRFAFPDDFALAMRKVAEHVIAKHAKDSPLGRFLEGMVDLRAECRDWEAAEPEVTLLFVFRTLDEIPSDAKTHAEALSARFRPTGSFQALGGQVVSLDTMTAARHLASDPLDFDYLSGPGPG